MSFRAALAGAVVMLATSSNPVPAQQPAPSNVAHAVPKRGTPASLPKAAPAQAADTANENAPAPEIAAPSAKEPEAAPSVSPPAAGTSSADADDTLPIPPVPPRISESTDYDRCLDMLPDDPSGADALAATLAASGATEPAQHCHALAQVELGNSAVGAALLDKLASTSNGPAASRAVLFGQADRAWTMAGDTAQAYTSATRALALSPDDPELLIGHAIAGMALQHCAEAAADLDRALELDPRRADAMTLRASAHRCLGQLDQAQADIDHALVLDDDNPDSFLERGIIRQRRGNLDGAREDWQHAAELAPDTATADLAEQNLALLEAGPRQ